MSKQKNFGMVWHGHHSTLVEYNDNIRGRRKDIRQSKPANEIPTRLRLLKRVKGKLPVRLMAKAKKIK